MFIWCHSFGKSLLLLFSGTERATLITSEKCVGVYECVSMCVSSPTRKGALGDVTGRREVLRRYFVKSRLQESLKVQIEMLRTDSKPKGVYKSELSPAALFLTIRIYSVNINLSMRKQKNSFIIQSKWNDCKVPAKRKKSYSKFS